MVALVTVVLAGVGPVVAWHQPRNPLGWLLESTHLSLWLSERG